MTFSYPYYTYITLWEGNIFYLFVGIIISLNRACETNIYAFLLVLSKKKKYIYMYIYL